MIGSASKYFGWSEKAIKWQMTFDNFNMYLATIPEYEDDDETDAAPTTASSKKTTGSINLFDIAARYGSKN